MLYSFLDDLVKLKVYQKECDEHCHSARYNLWRNEEADLIKIYVTATDLSHQMKRYMNSTDNTDSRYDTDITGEQLADNKIIYHP